MPRNMFDTNSDGQYKLIKPFINAISTYEGRMDSEDFEEYFMKMAFNAFSIVEEREYMPEWVFNEPDYRMKSEIMIVTTLFSVALEKTLNQECFDLDGRMYLTKIVYPNLRKMGQTRRWDMQAFHFQMIKTITQFQHEAFSRVMGCEKASEMAYN